MALLTLENNTEDYLKNIDIETFDESMSFMDCSLYVVAESERMWNDIMKEMATEELRHIAENGTQMVYEAGTIGMFFNNVVDFFKNLWSKIAGWFKKVFEWIEDHLDTNKPFVQKYKADIKKGYELMAFEGIDFAKFYTYENLAKYDVKSVSKKSLDLVNTKKGLDVVTAGTSNNGKDTDRMKEYIEQFKDKSYVENELSILRAALIPGSGERVSSKEFKKKAAEYFRGKEIKGKVSRRDVSLEEILDNIEKCVQTKRKVSESYKSARKEINDCITKAKNYQKTIEKDTENRESKLAYCKCLISLLKGAVSITTTLRGVHVTEIKNRCKQSKSLAVKLIDLKKKEKNKKKEKKDNKGTTNETNESYTYQYEDNDTFFTSDLL